MRGDHSRSSSSAIPLIDCAPTNPLDPIAHGVAVGRSEGQRRRWILRGANRCSGDPRPENPDSRRSLALDRSEHDGRLSAVRDGVASLVVPLITVLPIVLAMIVTLPSIAAADPPSRERFARHPAASDPRDPYAGFVAEAAKRFAISERWIRAVMQVESHDDPSAISPKGALGLMQIMPATWQELRVRYHLGDDILEPRDNILAGAAYLAELHDLYGLPGFLAAYNAGPGRYERHLINGDPLPPETVAYMAKLVPMIDPDATPVVRIAAHSRRNDWTDAPLFFAPQADVDKAETTPAEVTSKPTSATTQIADLSGLSPVSTSLFVQRGTDKGRGQ